MSVGFNQSPLEMCMSCLERLKHNPSTMKKNWGQVQFENCQSGSHNPPF